jgi:hypothetical protein
MPLSVEQYQSDLLLAKPEAGWVFAAGGLERVEEHRNKSWSRTVDIHSRPGVRVYYLRVHSGGEPAKISLSGTGNVTLALESDEFGILLGVEREEGRYTLWLPPASARLCFDEHQRIATPGGALASCQWEFQPHIIRLSVSRPDRAGEVIVVPYVMLRDPHGQFFEELRSLNDVERRLYRKSDWFFARTPSDVWNYLINGSVYDPRSAKKVGKRFKCQQCAHAWWVYFDFLYRETGKKIYEVMQDEVALSVLMDMSAEGGWRHGFWSDDMETHARFQLDGLHLLISQYEKTGEPIWLEAAERGMAFVSEHLMERLDDGSVWFLHDTIEHNKRHRFESTVFGKTAGNSLCINTHVQALTVLYRLHLAIPSKPIYGEMFEKGARALRRVLSCQPADLLYRLLMFLVLRYKVDVAVNSTQGGLKNILKGRIIRRVYWSARRRFPRLVQPEGFIERDLTRSFASDRYHIINTKDLLLLYQQKPLAWLRPFIGNGTTFAREFVHRLGVAAAVRRSPFYIELIDILCLYDALIEPVTSEEMDSVEERIYQQTGGYSLDYSASELVRGRSSSAR